MPDFVVIENFPDYGVNSIGEVFNLKTNRQMKHTHNQFGDRMVGLYRDDRQYKRSVKVLVAKAFVEQDYDTWDTVVLLDGDKEHVYASNLVWRPRWFAWRYSNQFTRDIPRWYNAGPIMDSVGNVYPTIMDAGVAIGSLFKDIQLGVLNGTRVFPGGERFRFVRSN